MVEKNGVYYLWKSFLWGRQLLQEGLHWRIGSGLRVDPFKDPWIPRLSSFCIVSTARCDIILVNELMNVVSGWDHDKVVAIFLPMDSEVIRAIPLGGQHQKDTWMWHYDRWGSFFVKSCYVIGAKKRFRIEESSNGLKKWCNRLWNLGIPPKAKHLIWRLFRNVILTSSNLNKGR